ncbi:MAG: thiamine pyrophosphate-dependent dehydrogenase E1 component subunit alpha [candidate division NC10 bacterium]|nr:thiamine pyrophosphate-dependent dehydrogenase E1 component subunit alpha [candidate division NC10 bacterium]
MSLTIEALLGMYRTMVRIRAFEERVDDLMMKGLIHGTTHLYIGMEAVATGVCSALKPEDYIASNHRGHGHCIAKGADLNRMMAELLGKATGYCKGKGGSMHIADLERGNLGATGIVGSGIPVATGAALAISMRKEAKVVACFFGDGAANNGAFHESLNLAAIWKLPVIYVCENNQYAMSGPAREMFAIPRIAERGSAYGIPGATVDGNDVLAVHAAATESIRRARDGHGPSLLTCETYRWKGHSRSDANRYRSKEEIAAWQARCPIQRLRRYLEELDGLDARAAAAIEGDVRAEVEEAVQFAEKSPVPSLEGAEADLYA